MNLLNQGARLIIVCLGILMTLSALVALFTCRVKRSQENQKRLREIQKMAAQEAMRQNACMFQRKAELDLLGLLDSRQKSKGKR